MSDVPRDYFARPKNPVTARFLAGRFRAWRKIGKIFCFAGDQDVDRSSGIAVHQVAQSRISFLRCSRKSDLR